MLFFFFFFDIYGIELDPTSIPIHLGPDVLNLKCMYVAGAQKISLPFLSCTCVIGTKIVDSYVITLYLIETPFNTFVKQSRPRSVSSCQSCLIRVYSVCLFPYD